MDRDGQWFSGEAIRLAVPTQSRAGHLRDRHFEGARLTPGGVVGDVDTPGFLAAGEFGLVLGRRRASRERHRRGQSQC